MSLRLAVLGSSLLVAVLAASRVGPVGADEAAPLPPLSRSDLELLPFDEAERLAFLRDHGPLVFRVETVLRRLERVEEQLAERARVERKTDGGAPALLEERARLVAQAETLLPEIEAALAAAGVPAGSLERARRFARGPLRVDGFGRALVLEVDGLNEKQRALFAHLVPAVHGAAVTLDAEARRLGAAGGEAQVALAERLAQRRRDLEKRFWRLVYWALDDVQRHALVARLPHELQKRDDGIGHVYLLEGLTPSQGVAFKALLLEIEAEAAADSAEVKRAQEALARGGLDADEKRAHERAKGQAERRLVDLQLRARDQGLAIFTPEQVRSLRSIVPHLTAEERRRPVTETLAEVVTLPEQRAAFEALTRKYAGLKMRIESGYLAIKRAMDDAGPESPEREMAEMQAAALGGEVARVLREAHGEVFLGILTPAQAEAWVLGL
jgi:hypothetical protein